MANKSVQAKLYSAPDARSLGDTTKTARIVITLTLVVLVSSSCTKQSPVRDDYKLTKTVLSLAKQGWELYQQGQFIASHNDGHYTDPNPETRVRDFWSNGRYATLDRDNNGHFETIF